MELKFSIILLFLLSSNTLFAQEKIDFEGQASAILSFSPENDLNSFAGGRYIPKFSYKIPLDSTRFIDFEASANISGTALFHPFDTASFGGLISPYRLWARYSAKQFELRIGLQKIDFGSANLLRPLQWFNQIDPRDPLQLTNGVYGVLGRYYFLNNANAWFWVLYGNEKTRGFDQLETYKKLPEFGGRFQYPVSKGELALSYHYRTANSIGQNPLPPYEKIPETRFGLDGKWDLKVGLWFEATYSHKFKDLNSFTNQGLLNLGTDYTFGLGNGLNVIFEHFALTYESDFFGFDQTAHFSGLTASYPISFFDNISTILYYDWTGSNFTFLLNYQHQFKHITGYLMAYYNPTVIQGFQQNELVNNFSGPGIRLILVYNH